MPGQSGRDLSLVPTLIVVRRPRERRLRRFRVHAEVAIAGYNMHVKSSWESVLQLAVLPQLVNLFQ